VWSPDGSQIVFDQPGEGVFKRASNGTGAEETLWKDQAGFNSTDWSTDGRFVLLSRNGGKTKNDLWLLPLAGDHKAVPLVQTPANEFRGRFSPAPGGGAPRWVSYESDESGKTEIYVMTMPGGAPGKWQISSGGGVNARWRRDGRELYFLGPDGQTIMAADVDPGPVFHAGTPHALFTINGLRGPGAWDVAADGSKFLASVAVEASTSPIHVVLNWQEGLKKP
jgi:Tol biopolymer transport system component